MDNEKDKNTAANLLQSISCRKSAAGKRKGVGLGLGLRLELGGVWPAGNGCCSKLPAVKFERMV
jgi:hypothetical protein